MPFRSGGPRCPPIGFPIGCKGQVQGGHVVATRHLPAGPQGGGQKIILRLGKGGGGGQKGEEQGFDHGGTIEAQTRKGNSHCGDFSVKGHSGGLSRAKSRTKLAVKRKDAIRWSWRES